MTVTKAAPGGTSFSHVSQILQKTVSPVKLENAHCE